MCVGVGARVHGITSGFVRVCASRSPDSGVPAGGSGLGGSVCSDALWVMQKASANKPPVVHPCLVSPELPWLCVVLFTHREWTPSCVPRACVWCVLHQWFIHIRRRHFTGIHNDQTTREQKAPVCGPAGRDPRRPQRFKRALIHLSTFLFGVPQ